MSRGLSSHIPRSNPDKLFKTKQNDNPQEGNKNRSQSSYDILSKMSSFPQQKN